MFGVINLWMLTVRSNCTCVCSIKLYWKRKTKRKMKFCESFRHVSAKHWPVTIPPATSSPGRFSLALGKSALGTRLSPRATPGTSSALRARGWGIVWSGPVPGVGEWGKSKILPFDFVKYVSFLARFTRWLPTSRLRTLKEKRRDLSESGWRGITYQN